MWIALFRETKRAIEFGTEMNQNEKKYDNNLGDVVLWFERK
jgi:hypothetical protein